jgi:hypothetical protein
MGYFRVAMAVSLFAFAVVALMLPTALASQDSYLDVKPYVAPNLNGAVSEGEYPGILVDLENFKLYASENGSYMFFSATIEDRSQDQRRDNVSLALDVDYHRSADLKTDDLLFTVCRDGYVMSCYGASSRWITYATPAGLVLKVSDSAGSWSFELAVPYSELHIEKGQPKTLGFALFRGNGGNVSSLFPSIANYLSPQSWSALNSSASWGVPDISLRVLMDPAEPKTNETVRLLVKYKNEGDSGVLGVRVNMSVDDRLVESRFDNRSLSPGEERSMEFNWTAPFGSHKLKFEAFSTGFDARVENNVQERTLEVSNISLVFLGPDGFVVYLDEYNGTITDGELRFSVPFGYRKLRCTSAFEVEPGVELRFVGWRLDGGEIKNNSVTLLVKDDLTIQVDFSRWLRVTFDFVDAYRRSIKVENYTVVFYDRSSLVASEPSLWVEDGTSFRVVKVYWEGVEVLRDEKVETVRERPRIFEVACKVYDLTLNIIDSIGLPVGNAKVEVRFANGTSVSLEADGSGVLKITQVPLGKIEGNVSSLGFRQAFSADATINSSPKIVTRFSAYVLAIFLVPILSVALLVLAFALKGQAGRKARAKERKETSPFEF